MKKLVIDINSIVPYYVSNKLNGIGRTTMELVQSLAEIPELPFEIVLYSQNMNDSGYVLSSKEQLYLFRRI